MRVAARAEHDEHAGRDGSFAPLGCFRALVWEDGEEAESRGDEEGC